MTHSERKFYEKKECFYNDFLFESKQTKQMTEGGQSAIIVFFTSEEIFLKKNTFAQILNAWAFLFETTKFLNEFVEQKKNNFKFFKFFKQSY